MFFLFKQKTAYEMRISDWSSDVCSSDLGQMGATACIVVPWFADRHAAGAHWQELAWWVHDHLPYSEMCFFPKRAAFNIQWHERQIGRASCRERVCQYV